MSVHIRYETDGGITHTERDASTERANLIRDRWLDRKPIRFAGERCFIVDAVAIEECGESVLSVRISPPIRTPGGKIIVFSSAEEMLRALAREPPDLCPM